MAADARVTIGLGVVGLALILGLCVLLVHFNRSDAIRNCSELFARAHTEADTTAIMTRRVECQWVIRESPLASHPPEGRHDR